MLQHKDGLVNMEFISTICISILLIAAGALVPKIYELLKLRLQPALAASPSDEEDKDKPETGKGRKNMKEELKKLRAKVEADALAREEVKKKLKIKEEELEKLEAELNAFKDESFALRLKAELQMLLKLCREHIARSREHYSFVESRVGELENRVVVLEEEKIEAEVKLENALDEKKRVEEQPRETRPESWRSISMPTPSS